MNFQKIKNLMTKNSILLLVIFINIFLIRLIYYNYGANGKILVLLLISIDMSILYLKVTSKFKTSSFSIESEQKIFEYDESKYNKLVDLRSNFIVGTYSFISTIVFSGVLFRFDIFDIAKKMGFANMSFIFFVLSFLGRFLYEHFLNQIKVYESALKCEILFENMPIVYFGKILVTGIVCMSFVFLIGLLGVPSGKRGITTLRIFLTIYDPFIFNA
ncbi:MAG: hypothetical protein ACRC8M_01430 [Cetobacterium sp.]|uniref:hypothetical protein n=1 Tax=Cetobacterium sp. TaxID=2071632 RepID=UPI003F3C9355